MKNSNSRKKISLLALDLEEKDKDKVKLILRESSSMLDINFIYNIESNNLKILIRLIIIEISIFY